MGILTSTTYKCEICGFSEVKNHSPATPAPLVKGKCNNCSKGYMHVVIENAVWLESRRRTHIRYAGKALKKGDNELAGEWLENLP